MKKNVIENKSLAIEMLKYLKDEYIFEDFTEEKFTAKRFNCSEEDFAFTLYELYRLDYIKGVQFGIKGFGLSPSLYRPHITLDGVEYLFENNIH